jgi:hypothetical protein
MTLNRTKILPLIAGVFWPRLSLDHRCNNPLLLEFISNRQYLLCSIFLLIASTSSQREAIHSEDNDLSSKDLNSESLFEKLNGICGTEFKKCRPSLSQDAGNRSSRECPCMTLLALA